MNAESLNTMHTNDLFDLLMQTMKELLAANEKKDGVVMNAKKNQVELIQRVIIAKVAESPAG